MNYNDFTVDRGVIRSARGIPRAPRILCDGRLNITIDEYGIQKLSYYTRYGHARMSEVFLTRLFDGLRYYVEIDKMTYKLGYLNTEIYPFAISADAEICHNGTTYRIRHSVILENETLIFYFSPVDRLPEGSYIKIELTDGYRLNPDEFTGDFRFHTDCNRIWQPFSYDAGSDTLCSRYDEDGGACDVKFCFKSGSKYTRRNFKHVVRMEPNGEMSDIYAVLCIREVGRGLSRSDILDGIEKRIAEQYAHYDKLRENLPVFESVHEELNAFMYLAPFYHESLKIHDAAGGVRANNNIYWIWGWDGMTANGAPALWNDSSLLRDMLEFYRASADPNHGIGMSIKYDNSWGHLMPYPSQGMYVNLLEVYYASTRDIDRLREYYPFAKKLISLACSGKTDSTGLSVGISMFPDFPEYMGEKGGDGDYSTFNNSILYCALRSFERLADIVGDPESRDMARRRAQAIEHSFDALLYDPEKGFYASSVDRETLTRRNCYNLNSLKTESVDLSDIFLRRRDECLEFIRENFVGESGLREIPLWCEAFDGDANQLHCWWPVNSEYFITEVNRAGDDKLFEKFIGYIEYWTKKLTYPEGIPYYIETDEPEFDRWNCLCGVMQAYTMRGWYQAVVHGIFGICPDSFGITIHPGLNEEMSFTNVHYYGRTLNFYRHGSTRHIDRIEINKRKLYGMNRVPLALLDSGTNDIHIYCADTADAVRISDLRGADVQSCELNDHCISVAANVHGSAYLHIESRTEYSLYANDILLTPEYRYDNTDVFCYSPESLGEAVVFTIRY